VSTVSFARIRIGRAPSIVAVAVAIATLAAIGFTLPAEAATNPPALHMTAGPFHDTQRISLSVGPNHYFAAYSHVNILECADPKGSKKKLPTNVSGCDGNTIQANTVLVNKNGSFSEHGYELFALPNTPLLGETPDTRPVCNQTKMCVLYVGQNQERFTAPKIFSTPFEIRKSGKHS
jgi:hypothetical protein